MREQLIYKLDGVAAEDGVDIFAIAPVLMKFGHLVRNANTVLDYGLSIDVRVKPFREGSWIAEFVLQSTILQDIVAFLKSSDGQTLAVLLALLGLNVKEGITGVARIIRFTRGKVGNFKRKEDNRFVYYNDSGETLVVSPEEHILVQSPLIQVNFVGSFLTPLDEFSAATGVSILSDGDREVQRFTEEDRPALEEYRSVELPEERVEENIVLMRGVFLKPKRGSYSGEQRQYSFMMGDQSIYPVTVEDEQFLEKLRAGDIRPYAEDILTVDLEVRQKRDTHNRLSNRYAITKVVEYSEYKKPKQYTIGDASSSE